jgi:3',5'-cyclic AMP phosphodiesterase CpdA
MLIAQLSDSHVHVATRAPLRYFDTASALARCIARVRDLTPAPDVVVFTGDLTETGKPPEYARFLELIAPLPMPWLVIPGNHDDREALRAALRGAGSGDLPARGPLCYADERFPLRLIGLDSTDPGRAGGSLDRARLAWLERTLAADARPALLMLHQAPFRAGIFPLDRYPFAGARELRAVVDKHPQVVGVICGHLHCVRAERWAATTVSSGPSTSDQLVPLVGAGRLLPRIAYERAAFRLLSWDGAELRERIVRVRD